MAEFRVLMNNKLELGTYEQPGHPTSTSQEYLIVEREGDVLAISDTNKIDPAGADDELANRQPNLTMYGLFLFEEGFSFSGWIRRIIFLQGPRTYYLLVREVPAGAPAAGNFFAVDGVAYVQWSFLGRWRLRAAGRHDNNFGRGSWQFTAGQRPLFALVAFNAADRFRFDGFGGGGG